MECIATVLKHERRSYVPKGESVPKIINSVTAFATLADGFTEPLQITLPPETPDLKPRADYVFHVVAARAWERQITFTADGVRPAGKA